MTAENESYDLEEELIATDEGRAIALYIDMHQEDFLEDLADSVLPSSVSRGIDFLVSNKFVRKDRSLIELQVAFQIQLMVKWGYMTKTTNEKGCDVYKWVEGKVPSFLRGSSK